MPELDTNGLFDVLGEMPELYEDHVAHILENIHDLDTPRLDRALFHKDKRLTERAEIVLAHRHSKDLRDFTQELHALAHAQDEANRETERRLNNFNDWMMGLTIAAGLLALASVIVSILAWRWPVQPPPSSAPELEFVVVPPLEDSKSTELKLPPPLLPQSSAITLTIGAKKAP